MSLGEKVGGVYYDVSMETSALLEAERTAKRSIERVGGHFDKLGAQVTAISAAISAAIGAIAIEGLTSKIIAAQRQFDVMFAGLKTMTGGVDQAGAAWERLVRFAAQTPYSLEQSVNGFVKLKALGLDPGERAMTSYGNTAAAMGKSLTQMIEAVADASTGEFERLKEFGIKAKQEGDKVSLTFRGTTTTIKNDADTITEYLTKLGEVEFAGAMSERMKTLDGDISNLQDSLAALYLSISQSGFGDAIAKGVRAATEAISEATASVKRGGLTDYFAELVPYIKAAEVAGAALAAVIAGRLVASFVAAAAQAYATAAAIGAASIAARGFAAVVAMMGGPIGIAVTGLTLLALNWDKVAGRANDAASISEDAAKRIASAQKQGPAIATGELSAQLAEYQKKLGKARQELTNLKVGTYGKGDANDIAQAQAKVEALEQAIERVKVAMVEAYSPGPREATSLPPPEPPKKRDPAKPKKPGAQFDSEAYLAGLERTTLESYAKIDAAERESLRKNDALLKAKKITLVEHMQAEKLIHENARQDRKEQGQRDLDQLIGQINDEAAIREQAEKRLAQTQADNVIAATTDEMTRIDLMRQEAIRRAEASYRSGAITFAQAEAEKVKAAVDAQNAIRSQLLSINPLAQLQRDYEAKLALVQQYETRIAQAGIDATGFAEAKRLELSRQFQQQRLQIAEAEFIWQSEANKLVMDSLNALSSSATQSLTGLLTGTMSASDAMRNLAGVVLNEAVGALVQIGVQYLKNALIGQAADKALLATKAANAALYTSAIAAQVGVNTALAAQGAFAATAAIPIIGPAMAPAAAAAAGAAAAAIGAPAVAAAPLAGARLYGGGVNAGGLYRVNESGMPEMFTGSNGAQYMLPTRRGSVTPADEVGGSGGGGWRVIINNAPAGTTATVDDQARTIEVAVAQAEARVADSLASNTGKVWSALRAGSNVQSRL